LYVKKSQICQYSNDFLTYLKEKLVQIFKKSWLIANSHNSSLFIYLSKLPWYIPLTSALRLTQTKLIPKTIFMSLLFFYLTKFNDIYHLSCESCCASDNNSMAISPSNWFYRKTHCGVIFLCQSSSSKIGPNTQIEVKKG